LRWDVGDRSVVAATVAMTRAEDKASRRPHGHGRAGAGEGGGGQSARAVELDFCAK
jgi:hypothetical protein